jgi:hypothetical protein
MGKQQRINKRKEKLRESTNPVGILGVEEFERIERLENETGSSVNNDQKKVFIPPVVKDLDNPASNVREQACMNLSNIVLEDDGVHLQQLIQVGAIKKLVQKLCDPTQSVRTAAAGALKNVTIIGGEQICENLVSNDVMTSLLAALNQSLMHVLQPKTKQNVEHGNSDTAIHENLIEQDENLDQVEEEVHEHKPLDVYEESIATLTEVIHLTSFLCENSDKATQILTQRKHISVNGEVTTAQCLMTILTNPMLRKYPNLLLKTVQCVNVIIDENAALKAQILQFPGKDSLIDLLNYGTPLFRTCVAGILFDVHSDSTPQIMNNTIEIVFPVLSQCIQFDIISQFMNCNLLQYKIMQRKKRQEDIGEAQNSLLLNVENREHINDFIKEQFTEDSDNEDDEEDIDDDKYHEYDQREKRDMNKRYREWIDATRAHNMGYEIITNIVSTLSMLNDPDQYEDIDDDEYDDDDDLQINQDDDGIQNHDGQIVQDDEQATQFIVKSDMFQICLERCIHLSQVLSTQDSPLFSAPLWISRELSLMYDALLRALNCLANMILSIHSNDLIKITDIQRLFSFLYGLCVYRYNNIGDTLNSSQMMDILESLTQMMWTLLRKPGVISMNTSLTSNAELFAKLACDERLNDEIRINAVGVLGEMGKRPHDVNHSIILARLLLNKVENDKSLAVVTEALNAIFDIFGDEKYKAVVADTKMLIKLQASTQSIDHRLREQKSSLDKELVGHVKEAKLNLVRFIKYIKNW